MLLLLLVLNYLRRECQLSQASPELAGCKADKLITLNQRS